MKLCAYCKNKYTCINININLKKYYSIILRKLIHLIKNNFLVGKKTPIKNGKSKIRSEKNIN